MEVRTGAIVKKNPEICSADGARSKNQHFSRFMVLFDCPVHSEQETVLPKPMVPIESRDSEGVSFASLESL